MADETQQSRKCKGCGYEFGQGFIVPPEYCGECAPEPEGWINLLPELKPYYDTGLGTYITSRKHRQQVMKEKGFIEVGGELKHVLGRWDSDRKREPLVSEQEFHESLQRIQHRMANDASYREYYERRVRERGQR